MPVLSAEQLKDKFRDEVDDPEEGVSTSEPDSENLWSNAEIYGYMNEAQHRWAEDTLALQTLFTLTIPADTRHVKLHERILNVRLVQLVSSTRWLKERNFNEKLIVSDYGQQTAEPMIMSTRVAAPLYYSLDVLSGYITLDSTQETEDALTIYASARPRTNLDSVQIIEATDPTDLRLIMHYMKYLAYDKQDADAYDKRLSADFYNKYENGVTMRKTQFEQRRRRAGTVRYSG
jgi:hypothetical protein